MATITITAVSFSPVPDSATNVVFKYKKAGDPTFTTLNGGAPVLVPANGILSSPIVINGLDAGTGYEISAQSDCGSAVFVKGASTPENKIWIPDQVICEQDVIFTEELVISNFSSPQALYYDEPTGRVYVVDVDDPAGNFFWFNPNTIANRNDVNYIPGLQFTIYVTAVDKQHRRVFGAGLNTNGCVVVHPTDPVTWLSYGTNAAFSRLLVKILDTTILTWDQSSLTIDLWDRANLFHLSSTNRNSLPSGAAMFEGAFNVTPVGSEVWVSCAQRYYRDIGIYTADLQTMITVIALPQAQVIPGWGFSRYWQAIFHDEANNKVYVGDLGSSKLFIIDTVSRTIVQTISFTNREGKQYVSYSFQIDEITGDLFMGYEALDAATDPNKIPRFYKINRTSLIIERVYMNQVFQTLILQAGTTKLWAATQGLTSWQGSNWQTDGKIIRYAH